MKNIYLYRGVFVGALALLSACADSYLTDPKTATGKAPLSQILPDLTSDDSLADAGSIASQIVDRVYSVTSAVTDSAVSNAGGGHSFYIPLNNGTNLRLIFKNPGTFTEYTDGTAYISGSLVDAADPTHQFSVTMNLSGRHDPVAGAPEHRELKPEEYKDKGGPIDPSTWHYYKVYGLIKGLGNVSDFSLTIVKSHEYDYQVGAGASGKNLGYGGGVWFYCDPGSSPSGYHLKDANSCTGDMNVNFTEQPTPPPPAKCDDGYHYNDHLKKCVKNPPPPPVCVEPQVWSPADQRCETPQPACDYSCQPGYTYDHDQMKCIKNQPVPPVVIYYPVPVYIQPVIIPIPVYYSPCSCESYYGY